MKTFAACVAVALATINGFAVGAEGKDAVKKDLEQLQGEWSMKSGSLDGFPIPDMVVSNFKRICSGNELVVKNGDQIIMKAKFTLDPSQSPKAIDYEVIDGPTKGKKHLGIYELDGETMKSCFGAPDMERPTEFATKAGDKRTLSVWQRAKK